MARDLVLEVVEQVRGNALDKAAHDLDEVATKTDKASGSARDYSGELKKLEQQIESTKLRVRSLGAEFVETHDKTIGTELRGERSLLRQLEKIRKEIQDASPNLGAVGATAGAAAGARASHSFITSFSQSLEGLPDALKAALIPALIGAGIAAAPALGAAVGGAVIGAVGLGGLAGGIFAAAHDPAVHEAAATFGQQISAEFFRDGQSFTGPVVESLHILQAAFAHLSLGDAFEKVSPYVTRVAEGIGGLAERFMPGFNRGLEAAGPALEILAQELPDIGAALGEMVADISNSQGTLEGWEFLLKAVGSTIRFTGGLLKWLGDRFHEQVASWYEATVALRAFTDQVPVLDGVVQKAQNRLLDILSAHDRAAGGTMNHTMAVESLQHAYERLNAETENYLGIQLSLDQANQRASQAMFNLRESLKENGKHWETNTKAGLANRDALINLVQVYIQQREASIAAGTSIETANAQFNAQLEALRKLAAQAGATKKTLQDLVGDYYINVHAQLIRENELKNAALPYGLGRIGGYASGGNPPTDGTPFWVGESGKELMQLGSTPRVYSHQQSMAMTSGGATSMKQIGESLAQIAAILVVLQQRQPTVINVNATERQSPKELAAQVQRELNWTR